MSHINYTKGAKMANDDLQYVVAMLKETNLAAVAEKVGLSYRTVWSIANESNKSPSFNTVRKLAEYFRGKA
jgi:DNA-binding XRE family transcriptional regulator